MSDHKSQIKLLLVEQKIQLWEGRIRDSHLDRRLYKTKVLSPQVTIANHRLRHLKQEREALRGKSK